MGYTLKIGEAKISYSSSLAYIDCDVVKFENAPAYGEPTDRENQRWPSYTGWSTAMAKLGMTGLMFEGFKQNGMLYPALISEHPGVTPITKTHVEFAEKALASYKAKYPDHIAQYPPPKPNAKPVFEGSDEYLPSDLDDNPIYDEYLCRGEWLVFWLRWAVENCKQPVFVNS